MSKLWPLWKTFNCQWEKSSKC